MMEAQQVGAMTAIPTHSDKGLGRVPSFDIRDMAHPMRSILKPKTPAITQKYWWTSGWWGDQGATSQCVGYAWAHFLEDSPVTHPDPAKTAIVKPEDIYREAQLIDEWPGENYDGTSVRAGVKVLQKLGYIESYLWAWDLNTVVNALLTTGPVVVGTNWYEGMYTPNSKGLIKIAGEAIGGHAYLLNGVNTKTKMIRLKNSWGREWSNGGHATISFADMERLISEYGEACLAIERKVLP